MNYEKYWSISDLGTNSLKSYEVCLYITILFVLFFILTKKFKNSNQDYEKTFLLWSTGLIGFGAFLCFIYLKFFIIDNTEERVHKILNSNSVAVVEGSITNFKSIRPISRRGVVTQESFVVDTINFSYSDEFLGRFNTFSKTNNGVFRDGLQVRITYGKKSHEILMVEIKK